MTSANLMHEAGHSKLVLWDNPGEWGREGGDRRIQDGWTHTAQRRAKASHAAQPSSSPRQWSSQGLDMSLLAPTFSRPSLRASSSKLPSLSDFPSPDWTQNTLAPSSVQSQGSAELRLGSDLVLGTRVARASGLWVVLCTAPQGRGSLVGCRL